MFKDQFDKLINEREITVHKLSKEIAIPRTTMYDWKAGRTEPGLKYLKRLSEYFDVPISYFAE